jgi:6-phosphofructokinase
MEIVPRLTMSVAHKQMYLRKPQSHRIKQRRWPYILQVTGRLKELGVKTTIVAKNNGYELRCADPIPYDMEYARDLGYCAAKYLGNLRAVALLFLSEVCKLSHRSPN